MMIRVFLAFARLLAIASIFGLTYAGYALHLSLGVWIVLIVLWFLMFGALFKAPA